MFIEVKHDLLTPLKLRLAAGKFAFMLFAIGLCLSGAKPAQAILQLDAPFSYFNVYSLGDIDYSGSDFEGKAGAAGDASFNNFSLALNDQGGYALHAGGNATLTNGGFHGGIEAGKNILMGGLTIYGDVHGGENIGNTSGGTILGDVYAGGNATLTPSISYYSQNSGVPYSPAANLAGISSYFSGFSTMVGDMTNTGAIGSAYGTLTISALSGINVFSLSAADLNTAHTVKITGGNDAIVYINAIGTTASLNSTTWKYYGGIASGDVLLNYADAATLAMIGSNSVNILAPFADTSFTDGLVTGNLIVGNLTGDGQVNLGYFGHGPQISPIPEPASALLLCAGLALIALRLRNRREALTQ